MGWHIVQPPVTRAVQAAGVPRAAFPFKLLSRVAALLCALGAPIPEEWRDLRASVETQLLTAGGGERPSGLGFDGGSSTAEHKHTDMGLESSLGWWYSAWLCPEHGNPSHAASLEVGMEHHADPSCGAVPQHP